MLSHILLQERQWNEIKNIRNHIKCSTNKTNWETDLLSVGGLIRQYEPCCDLYRHAARHHDSTSLSVHTWCKQNSTAFPCLKYYVTGWSNGKLIFIFAKFPLESHTWRIRKKNQENQSSYEKKNIQSNSSENWDEGEMIAQFRGELKFWWFFLRTGQWRKSNKSSKPQITRFKLPWN
jgi:hypothetical protein